MMFHLLNTFFSFFFHSCRYLSSACFTLLALMLMFVGCGESIELPPAPESPPMIERARDFNRPLGDFSDDDDVALSQWMKGEGGTSTLSLILVMDVLISKWLDGFIKGENSKKNKDLEDLLKLNGWAELDIPCGSSGALSLNLLLSTKGLSPVVWGVADQCTYEDLGLIINAEVILFLPTLTQPFFRGEWGLDEPNGLWVDLNGKVELNGIAVDINQVMMRDQESGLTRTLWEPSDRLTQTRFIITLPLRDWATVDISQLNELILEVKTMSGDVQCEVASQECQKLND